jgi:hypothetical protein
MVGNDHNRYSRRAHSRDELPHVFIEACVRRGLERLFVHLAAFAHEIVVGIDDQECGVVVGIGRADRSLPSIGLRLCQQSGSGK